MSSDPFTSTDPVIIFGTGIIFILGPLVTALAMANEARKAILSGVAEWPNRVTGIPRRYPRQSHPVQFWLVTGAFSLTAIAFLAIPFLIYGNK